MITVIHFCKLLNIESTKIESSVIIWWHLALLIQKKKTQSCKKTKKIAGWYIWVVCRRLGELLRQEEERVRTMKMEGHAIYLLYVQQGRDAKISKQVR